jgi:hypothetical protein
MKLGVCLFSLLFAACTATINADFRGRGDVPANSDEIKGCKDSCQAQKNASCMTDSALAACNTSCDLSTSDQATQYQSCVKNNACGDCAKSLPTPDAGPPPDAGSKVDAAPPPVDAAKPDANDAASEDSAVDNSLQDCQFRCEETSPPVVNCYSDIPSGIAQCKSSCQTAPRTSRETFVSCVNSLATVPQTSMCDQFMSQCLPIIQG